MANKLSKNVLLSGINTIVTLLFPLITYPYVARVLNPEGLGLYNIAFSIMSYFLLFANLGIPLFATRAVAVSRSDNELLRKESSGIFSISLIATVVAMLAFLLFIFFDAKAKANFWIYFIMGFHMLGICLNVEWYYQGTERYGYITVRNICVKLVCIVCIFLFVKKSSDVLNYTIIMIMSVLVYSFFNFGKFCKEIRLTFRKLNLAKYVKPLALTFLLYAASRIANGIDVVMMNYMLGDRANYLVGQYTSATKVINLVIDLMLVINTVMLPRISTYLSEGKHEEVRKLLKRVFSIVLMFTLPACVGLALTSREIVLLLSGEQYAESIVTMQIMSLNVLFVTMSNFLGIQVLYSYGKEKSTSIAILIGAAINFTLNFILIPKLTHEGAGIATVISNFVIMAIELVFVLKFCRFKMFTRDNLKSIIATGVMAVPLYLLIKFNVCEDNILISLILKIAVGVLSYAVAILVLRHSESKTLIRKIVEKSKARGKKEPPTQE